jgi:EmrB/QacA subfamily drug resistance transporter
MSPSTMLKKTNPDRAATSKWWVLLSVGIGTFMSALDGSIVNAILPVVQQALHTDVATIQWVVVIYLLVVSGLLLSVGRLGDLRGQKPVYASGFTLFIFGSALCGLTVSPGMLIASRGVQALGAAMIFATSPAILTKTFPANQRGQALGLQATMTYLGLACGPALGGLLAETIGWRSVFYINVPIGLVALAFCLWFVPSDTVQKRRERFDWLGAGVFTCGLVALLLGLNRGHAWGWTSPGILAMTVASPVLLAVFVHLESRATSPMLDLGLFHSGLFSASTASAMLNYVCVSMVAFLVPFYLIQGRGLSPAQAGLLLTIQPLVMAVAAPLSGTVSDRVGSRWPATAGMLILAVGVWLLSQLDADSSWGLVELGLIVTGLGTGIFISPNNSALMGAAPRNRQGIAAGVLATARNVGMVLGVGLAGAVLTTALAHPGNGDLVRGIELGLKLAAIAALVGAVTSILRGERVAGDAEQESP